MNMHIESEILSYRPETLHASTQALIAEITAGIEVPHGVGRKFRARKAKKQVERGLVREPAALRLDKATH